MAAQEMSVEQLARLFHRFREALALATESHLDSGQNSWRAAAAEELNRMEEEAHLALRKLGYDSQTEVDARRYYAKPGEAEWGC